MKKCWDHSPETRPMAEEIYDCLLEYASKNEIIELAETKRQEIIKSDKFLIDTKNYKHHPESCYTSRLLNKSIQQAESLLNLSSTEIQFFKNFFVRIRFIPTLTASMDVDELINKLRNTHQTS